MKQILLVGLLMIAVIISGCSSQQPATPAAGDLGQQITTTAPNNTGQTTSNTPANTNTLLTDEPYFNQAHLISGDTLDDSAKTAMSGFSMSKTPNNDGTTTILLTSTNPEYQNQSYILKAGQKLYFIEMSLGDDGGNQEGYLLDDKAVVVDADGYVVG